MPKKAYTGNSIEVMEFPENVRHRPGFYIGGSGKDAMHHLIWEIFDNSVDEAVAGHCKKIIIQNEGDGYLGIIDDGRGIPVDINKKMGKSALEVVFTVLSAGGKFHNDSDEGGYKVSGGLHGVGASVCNALSTQLEVYVKRDNKIHYQEFKEGNKQCEVTVVKECPVEFHGKTGTYVRFKPDKKVFKHVEINFEQGIVVRRAREISFLVPGLEIEIRGWKDEEGNSTDVTFKHDNGLHDFVAYRLSNKVRLIENVAVDFDLKDLGCTGEAVFTYETQFDENLVAFANNITTHEGGVHREAFLAALTNVIVAIGEKEKLLKGFEGKIKKSHVQEGLIAIVSVKLVQPEFEGQTKTKLGNPEVRKPMEEVFTEGIMKQLSKRKDDMVAVATKIIESVKAQDAARKAKDLTRKKGGLDHLLTQGKLSPCESKDPEECELFLCEGDCFAGDTLVHTEDGLRRLDSIQTGDKVYTHLHRFRTVTVRKPTYKTDKVRVTIDGQTFVCSADHLWLVMRCDDDVAEWVPAGELEETDLIIRTGVMDQGPNSELLKEMLFDVVRKEMA